MDVVNSLHERKRNCDSVQQQSTSTELQCCVPQTVPAGRTQIWCLIQTVFVHRVLVLHPIVGGTRCCFCNQFIKLDWCHVLLDLLTISCAECVLFFFIIIYFERGAFQGRTASLILVWCLLSNGLIKGRNLQSHWLILSTEFGVSKKTCLYTETKTFLQNYVLTHTMVSVMDFTQIKGTLWSFLAAYASLQYFLWNASEIMWIVYEIEPAIVSFYDSWASVGSSAEEPKEVPTPRKKLVVFTFKFFKMWRWFVFGKHKSRSRTKWILHFCTILVCTTDIT